MSNSRSVDWWLANRRAAVKLQNAVFALAQANGSETGYLEANGPEANARWEKYEEAKREVLAAFAAPSPSLRDATPPFPPRVEV